jgi:hypothetical protein
MFYNGRFDRGEDDICPPDHGSSEQNISFGAQSAGSRYGFASHLAASGGWNGKCLRAHLYERLGEATRVIILDDEDSLWDSSSLTDPILTFVGTVTDFSLRTINNRAYISPHDGNVGETGEVVYVYEGTGNARVAAGSPPAGYTLGAEDDGAGGKIEVGNHLFAVAYETDTGFITQFGIGTGEVKNFESTVDARLINIFDIPTGGAGIVGRYLVATAALGETYNGNPAEQEWFFVPDGHIENNSVTEFQVNFFDADLLESADYLQYQKSTIPAGVQLLDFDGRMIVVGDPSAPGQPWVSSTNEPESFSDLDGFISIDPGDAGGGVKNGVSNRGTLYLAKSQRFYAVTDNGAAPSTWKADRVDASTGAECFSIGRILNAPGAMQEDIFVADRSGLYLFPPRSGGTEPLTWKIQDLWDSINQINFWKVQVFVDQINSKIYVNAPIGATAVNSILVGDFQKGLGYETIRWSKWVTPTGPTSIWIDIDTTTKRPVLRYGSLSGSLYKYSTARTDYDGSNVINAFVTLGLYPEDSAGAVFQMTDIRLRVSGSGALALTLAGIDGVITATLPSMTLAATPGREYSQGCNSVSEKTAVTFRTNNSTDWFNLVSFRLDSGPVWYDRPR